MRKNILKINRWKETQSSLFKFIENENTLTGDEIRAWIANCIVFFTELKMENYIVEYFLSKLDFTEKQIEIERSPLELQYVNEPIKKYVTHINIGPFIKTRSGYHIKNDNRLTGTTGGKSQLTPILVAFRVAENIIENYEDEEMVVPKIILNQFENIENKTIYLSLKGIQDSYIIKDIEGMLSSLITTTDLICSLIPELKNKEKIKGKLEKLHSLETLLTNYNINKEWIWALNNSRIIRNCDEHYPKEENHTTLFECVSYCHILVLFISSIIGSGKITLK